MDNLTHAQFKYTSEYPFRLAAWKLVLLYYSIVAIFIGTFLMFTSFITLHPWIRACFISVLLVTPPFFKLGDTLGKHFYNAKLAEYKQLGIID